MGFEDRDYMKETPAYRLQFGTGWSDTVKILVAINISVFIIHEIVQGNAPAESEPIYRFSYLSYSNAVQSLQIWRFITYQFMHDSFIHILFNMLALYGLGPIVERNIGAKAFLKLYLIGGVIGGLVSLMLTAVVIAVSGGSSRVSPNTQVIGASASIFALIIAAYEAQPELRFFFLTRSVFLWILITVSAAFVVAKVATDQEITVAHEAHLGGLAFGWFRVRRSRPSARARSTKRNQGRWEQKRRRELASLMHEEEEVDRILAKVHEEGLTSLSRKEKKILQRATDRQKDEDRRINQL